MPTQYSIFLATPRGLTQLEPVNLHLLKFGRMLIVRIYDFGAIWAWVEDQVGKCEGASWNEVLDKPRFLFDWEYEYDQMC